MPLDQLKIAETFVSDISTDPANAFIIQTIINLGRNLGLQVIAEGVEQQGELDFLQSHGCELFQGYLFSKPLPADEMLKLMHHEPC
jgi:EAL domain-containing protein (putative c-di-GMP-specific phosphodiesterase class I)